MSEYKKRQHVNDIQVEFQDLLSCAIRRPLSTWERGVLAAFSWTLKQGTIAPSNWRHEVRQGIEMP